jgi:hypothetical protein
MDAAPTMGDADSGFRWLFEYPPASRAAGRFGFSFEGVFRQQLRRRRAAKAATGRLPPRRRRGSGRRAR